MKTFIRSVIATILLVALTFTLTACGSKYHLNDAMKEHLQSSLDLLGMVADGSVTEDRYVFGTYTGAYMPLVEDLEALGFEGYGTDTYNDCQDVLDYINQFFDCIHDDDYVSARQILYILWEYAE